MLAKVLLLATAVVLTAICGGRTQVYNGADCSNWTEWFDVDDPSVAPANKPDEDGDYETPSAIRNNNKNICDKPTAIEARTVPDENGNSIRATDTWDDLYSNTPIHGLICRNEDQATDKNCQDYRVRFCCPAETTGCPRWTRWLNRKNPAQHNGYDLENFKELQEQACPMPTQIRARVADANPQQLAEDTGEIFHAYSPTEGLVCSARSQTDGECLDYEVSFCCPLPDCPRWLGWISMVDPMTSTGGADTELVWFIKQQPGYEGICDFPSYVQARTVDGKNDALQTNERISILFNNGNKQSIGFLCDNDDTCANYEVRFCCPEEPRHPKCDNSALSTPEYCWSDADCHPSEKCFHDTNSGFYVCCPDQAAGTTTPGPTTTPDQTTQPNGTTYFPTEPLTTAFFQSTHPSDTTTPGPTTSTPDQTTFEAPTTPESSTASPPTTHPFDQTTQSDQTTYAPSEATTTPPPTTRPGGIDPYCEGGFKADPLVYCVSDADCGEDQHCYHHPGWSVCCPDAATTSSSPTTPAPEQTTEAQKTAIALITRTIGAPCPDEAWLGPFNEDRPLDGDGGDHETLERLRVNNRICDTPIGMKYSTVVGAAEEVLDTFDETIGLICLNGDQEDDLLCEDYTVWFCCPGFSTTPSPPTTSAPDPATTLLTTGKPPYCEYGTISNPVVYCETDADCPPNEHCYHRPFHGWSVCCPKRTAIASTSEPATVPPGQTPGPVTERPCSIDIVIVIDVSSSMPRSEFLRILQFLIEFIQCFNGVDVQIGIITYECLPRLDVRLGTFTLGDPGLTDTINGLEHRGGNSRTGQALHYVKCMTDFREGGWSLVMILTDGTEANGRGTNDYIAQAGMLRDSGIEMYGVAVGHPLLINKAGLATITGNPDRVVDPTDPCELANRIIEECCGEN